MTWIEPLNLEQWFINVMAGSSSYFAPIAIFCIVGMGAFFRMTGLTLGFMLFIFLLMFSGYVPASLIVFISIIGGLLVGYAVSKITKY